VTPAFPLTREDTSAADSRATNDNPRAFLELFEIPERNSISQYFHFRVREGADTPCSVAVRVAAHVGARIAQAWGDEVETRRQRAYLDALSDHLDLALQFAQHVIDWEALPATEREARKAERGRVYQFQAMATQPPTDRQLAYLARLGYRGAEPESKASASALISRWLDPDGEAT
jgi:hypothetical protein